MNVRSRVINLVEMQFILVTDPFALKFCSLVQNNIVSNIRDKMIFVTCEQTLICLFCIVIVTTYMVINKRLTVRDLKLQSLLDDNRCDNQN